MSSFLFTSLSATLALLALPSVAGATHSTSVNPPQDFAVGSGKTVVIGNPANAAAFSLSAHRKPNGEVSGFINERHVTFTGEEVNGKGHVECLDVQGNRAVAIGRFEGTQPFGPAYPFVMIFVEDNGEPSDPVPDRGVATARTSLPEPCPPFPGFGFLAAAAPPLLSGNVTVHDSPLVP